MDKVTVVFTKNNRSAISWLIRWALPRSRFALALSSHCFVKVGDMTYDMGIGKKLAKVDFNEAMKGCVTVAERTYLVPSLADGVKWGDAQIGKAYDIKGALGVAISPDRDWSDDSCWFCYEFTAGFLKECGLDIFQSLAHVTEIPLLALRSY
jgi:hypothetical protein